MKRSGILGMLFYLGLLFFLVYEMLKVYLIMPLPGSQRGNTLQLAFYLNRWTPVFNILFLVLVCFGGVALRKTKRVWIPFTFILIVVALTYLIRTNLRADKMFRNAETVTMSTQNENKVDSNALVIGVEMNGDAKAFPIRFLAYHHQIYSGIGGINAIVTYCDVCHSGRVYKSEVRGRNTQFRLVGMDHFNAMFEDPTTKSWWRQETGECVAGPLKGEKLEEILSMQMSVGEWYRRYPNGKLMQPDPQFIAKYDITGSFEQGKDKSGLTRTDSLPWKEKSLVLGITIGSASKAYDWNELTQKKLVNDELASQKIVVITGSNGRNFSVFLNTTDNDFQLEGNMIRSGEQVYDANGIPTDKSVKPLVRIHAYQEFWHSWKTFHPGTKTYPEVNPN